MFDVRIFHPYAKTYENQKLADIYSRHEKEKQRNYLKRVLQSEKVSFFRLYSTHGGMANEAKMFHKKVVHMIADQTRESYGDVIDCMRTRVKCLISPGPLFCHFCGKKLMADFA